MTDVLLDTELLWTMRELFNYPDLHLQQDNTEGLARLAAWIKKQPIFRSDSGRPWPDLDGPDWNELQIDHTGLFINGVPTAKAHPFAGWYEGDTILFGPTERRMRDFYHYYGVDFDSEQTLPADHILVELEFIALMADKYNQTGEEVFFTAMQEMLTGHMEQWIFKFTGEISRYARTNFYRGLAQALELMIKCLANELKEVA